LLSKIGEEKAFMKLLDDKKTVSAIDKIVDRISGANTIILGPVKIELPEEYAHKKIGQYKFWQAEDIADLIDNYSLVSKLDREDSEYNKKLNDWFQETVLDMNLSEKDFKEFYNELLKILEFNQKISMESRIPPEMENNNIVILENIYLGNFSIAENKYYHKCEMKVKDNKGENISGVMYYNPKFVLLKERQNDIDKVLPYKEYTKPFDITFKAMPLYIKQPGKKKLTTYPPKIEILSITNSDGLEEVIRPSSNKDYVPVQRK